MAIIKSWQNRSPAFLWVSPHMSFSIKASWEDFPQAMTSMDVSYCRSHFHCLLSPPPFKLWGTNYVPSFYYAESFQVMPSPGSPVTSAGKSMHAQLVVLVLFMFTSHCLGQPAKQPVSARSLGKESKISVCLVYCITLHLLI